MVKIVLTMQMIRALITLFIGRYSNLWSSTYRLKDSWESAEVQSSESSSAIYKRQTRAEEMRKCLDKGLEQTSYSSIFKQYVTESDELKSLLIIMHQNILGQPSKLVHKT